MFLLYKKSRCIFKYKMSFQVEDSFLLFIQINYAIFYLSNIWMCYQDYKEIFVWNQTLN
jgi:hypothetical protein